MISETKLESPDAARRPLRVLHVVGDSKYGGGAPIILGIARMARDHGCRVDVLTNNSIIQKEVLSMGLGVVDLTCIWRNIRPLRDTIGLLRLIQYLRHEKYDIIHTHTSKGGFVGRLAARLAGVPVILHTVQGFAFHEQSSFLFLHVYSLLERWAANWCDGIIFVTNFHRDWAARLGIGDTAKHYVIHNAIDRSSVCPDRSREEMKRDLGIGQDTTVILTMGRLAEQKGHRYLFGAIRSLSKTIRQKVCFLIVGEGPLEASLQEQCRNLGLQEVVKFLGFRRDTGNLLNMSDVVVIPSLWEGLSIALLEAMAAGKPVITTAIGSNVEVIGTSEAALLVPPADETALTLAIQRVVQDTLLRAELSEKCRTLFQTEYVEEVMQERYREVYEKVCAEKIGERVRAVFGCR